MDNTLIIFACVALAAAATLFVVLSIAAIRAMRDVQRVADSVHQVSSDLREFKVQLVPLVTETTRMVKKTEQTLERVDHNLELITKGTQTFADIAQDIRALERDLVSQVQQPLNDLTSVLSGALGRVSSMAKKFVDRWT